MNKRSIFANTFPICSRIDAYNSVEALVDDENTECFTAEAIKVGWEDPMDTSPTKILDTLLNNRQRFPKLRGFFLGDIPSHQSEISWITLTNVTKFIDGFPKLTHFKARGGSGLLIDPITHTGLTCFEVESGGLSCKFVKGLCDCKMPNLETLHLWLGTDSYGATWELSDLDGLLKHGNFPSLKNLGLRNSHRTNELVNAVMTSKILGQLEFIDFSMGTLGDQAARLLIELWKFPNVKEIDISHHWVRDETIETIKDRCPNLKIIHDQAGNPMNGEDDRYVVVGE